MKKEVIYIKNIIFEKDVIKKFKKMLLKNLKKCYLIVFKYKFKCLTLMEKFELTNNSL
jgi:hypothetical protein